MSDTCGTCEHWSPQRYGPANGLCKRDTTPAAATPASLEACPSHLPLGSAKGPAMSEQSLDAIGAAGARAWAGDDRRCGTCCHCVAAPESEVGASYCFRLPPNHKGRRPEVWTDTRACGEWAATPEGCNGIAECEVCGGAFAGGVITSTGHELCMTCLEAELTAVTVTNGPEPSDEDGIAAALTAAMMVDHIPADSEGPAVTVRYTTLPHPTCQKCGAHVDPGATLCPPKRGCRRTQPTEP